MKFFEKACVFVDVAKLVDAHARGACGATLESSNLSIDTESALQVGSTLWSQSYPALHFLWL